ncbi:MAG: NYN domain-containing protein [Desulfobacterales bacterium]|nr:NYN domain-containing protein [Desulfobacterales bacterium]
MSLHIIIDGYNLIRQSAAMGALDDQDIQLGRDALLENLATYKKIKRHRITVVFDGSNAPVLSRGRDKVKGVDVVFSRQGELADAVIKRMVKKEREGAIVVTSDREVADYAASRAAAVISSPDFEDKLTMAAYMDLKGVDEEDEGGWKPTTKKKGPSRRLPRRKRRNRVKIEKL